MRKAGGLSFGFLAALGIIGCGNRGDGDGQRRPEWVHQQTVASNRVLFDYLNRAGDIEFLDGWYGTEHDPKTGGAWRWMSGRSITRLATRPGGRADTTDMELKVFGWAPHEHLDVRTYEMEFAINGHVLERLVPPKGNFEHVIIVPKGLLGRGSHVDFVITVTNTGRPSGDWRELGFATTGFQWNPVQAI